MDTQDLSARLSDYAGLDAWVLQVFLVVLLTLVVDGATRLVIRRVRGRAGRKRTPWDDALFSALGAPASLLLWIAGLSAAVEVIQREAPVPLFAVVPPVRDLGIIATIVWFVVRFIRIAEANVIAQREREGKAYDRTTLDAIAKLLRAATVITGVLVALQTLGYSISGVLAFGGIGGLAMGFAAKDLLANFFGGLMIYLDRPFNVGDWIRSPDQEIEGTVLVRPESACGVLLEFARTGKA